MRTYKSHGTGKFSRKSFRKIGKNVIFERGVMVFHPENIEIGSNVYIGHNAFLKGYYKNSMKIGSNTWIGQGVFLHSGGGIRIGNYVGIGPFVKIITLQHVVDRDISRPIITREQIYEETVLEDGCDIGTGAIILPGIRIGRDSVVGAGSVVTKDVPPYSIVAGNPAKLLRKRK
ncbi:MAG: acyltransferase [Elusimicrobia bacterium]|nr:acyltransferase [Elusimicrobiota bacterium]